MVHVTPVSTSRRTVRLTQSLRQEVSCTVYSERRARTLDCLSHPFQGSVSFRFVACTVTQSSFAPVLGSKWKNSEVFSGSPFPSQRRKVTSGDSVLSVEGCLRSAGTPKSTKSDRPYRKRSFTGSEKENTFFFHSESSHLTPEKVTQLSSNLMSTLGSTREEDQRVS